MLYNQGGVEVISQSKVANNITMKLILVCTAVVLLMSAVELAKSPRWRVNSMEKIYREYNVTPVPEEKVDLYYGDYEVTVGMEVRPEDVKEVPVIGFQFNPGCYYTVVMCTPDWPSSNYSYMSPYLLWMTVNNYYSSDGCEESCEIATLLNPSPPPGTGIHRYVVEVYKQYEMIDTNDDNLCSYQTSRQNFSPPDFVKAYNLISPPVGGCMFTSKYPESEY